MGECGLKAGARKVMESMFEKLKKSEATDVVLTASDCAGKCDLEPMITVEEKDTPPITYIKIDNENHLVMISASRYQGSEGAVCGFNPENGDHLWTYKWKCKTPVPNVTEIGNDQLFVTGGYRAGGALIQIEKKGNSWELGFNYANIEANALISAWADSNFGFTNRKGTKLSFKYQIYKNLQFATAWYHTDKIVDSDPWDKLQIDMIFKF